MLILVIIISFLLVQQHSLGQPELPTICLWYVWCNICRYRFMVFLYPIWYWICAYNWFKVFKRNGWWPALNSLSDHQWATLGSTENKLCMILLPKTNMTTNCKCWKRVSTSQKINIFRLRSTKIHEEIEKSNTTRVTNNVSFSTVKTQWKNLLKFL